MKSDDRPIRVLHYVNQWSNQGGVESWLMNIFRLTDSSRITHHLLIPQERYTSDTHDTLFARYNVTRVNTACVARSPYFRGEFARRYLQHGPFDVVHAHNDYVGGPVLRLAKTLGVPIRIAHAHNDIRVSVQQSSLLRKFYINRSLSWIQRYATHGFAASEPAGKSVFQKGWGTDHRWQPLYYGIDLDRFTFDTDPLSLRRSLRIPENAYVIGHVGRFHPQKNHDMIFRIAEQVLLIEPRAYFLLVGDGPSLANYKKRANGISGGERIHFLGIRDDVPELMRHVMDVFLFPSRWEGLGIVLLEAQAAGLPYVASDRVPQEADVLDGFCVRLRLDKSVKIWTESVLEFKLRRPPLNAREAIAALRGGPFDSNTSASRLADLYYSFVTQCRIGG